MATPRKPKTPEQIVAEKALQEQLNAQWASLSDDEKKGLTYRTTKSGDNYVLIVPSDDESKLASTYVKKATGRNWTKVKNFSLQRDFNIYNVNGAANLPDVDEYKELIKAILATDANPANVIESAPVEVELELSEEAKKLQDDFNALSDEEKQRVYNEALEAAYSENELRDKQAAFNALSEEEKERVYNEALEEALRLNAEYDLRKRQEAFNALSEEDQKAELESAWDEAISINNDKTLEILKDYEKLSNYGSLKAINNLYKDNKELISAQSNANKVLILTNVSDVLGKDVETLVAENASTKNALTKSKAFSRLLAIGLVATTALSAILGIGWAVEHSNHSAKTNDLQNQIVEIQNELNSVNNQLNQANSYKADAERYNQIKDKYNAVYDENGNLKETAEAKDLKALNQNLADAYKDLNLSVADLVIKDEAGNVVEDHSKLEDGKTYTVEVSGKVGDKEFTGTYNLSATGVAAVREGSGVLTPAHFANTKAAIDHMEGLSKIRAEKEEIFVDKDVTNYAEMFNKIALSTATDYTFKDKDGNLIEKANLTEGGEYYLVLNKDFKARLSESGIAAFNGTTESTIVTEDMFATNEDKSNAIVGYAITTGEANADYVKKITGLEGNIKDIAKKLGMTEEELKESIETVVESITTNIETLQTELNNKKSDLEIAEATVEKYNTLTNKLNNLKQKYSELNDATDENIVETIDTLIESAKTGASDAQAEVSRLTGEVTRLEGELKTANQTIYELQNKENENGSYAPGNNGDNTGSTVTEGNNKAPSNGDSNANVSDRPGSGSLKAEEAEKENENNEDTVKVDEKGNVVIESGWTFGG